jgi:hypothetical protein
MRSPRILLMGPYDPRRAVAMKQPTTAQSENHTRVGYKTEGGMQMKRTATTTVLALLCALVSAPVAFAQSGFTVTPHEFDPVHTHLVAAEWKSGLGCPTNAITTTDGVHADALHQTDPACTSGDPRDRRNEGLLLAKTGPTFNYASAEGDITGVEGLPITELGYDLRKSTDFTDLRGSHCGAGAPRFDVITQDDVDHFVGCASPPPTMTAVSQSWIRLRWGPAQLLVAGIMPTDTIKVIALVFDEGTDTNPDYFGLAVLDNIDVNGALVGRGPRKADEDEGGGEDGAHNDFDFRDSPSHPESSDMAYHDQSKGMNVQSVNGARSVTYSGACVSLAGDALLNGNPGYLFTFQACDLSVLGIGIGNFAIAVTGPAGFLYQKSAALTSGYVSIHPH